ncbi:hypothetical protein [Paenibacillus wenxiniae]|uniref:Uncharacterized protein n=1 Tax=Paenibacillus wenxiniae TaxID=1636843 RepID=A0ABW4RQ58_9BACL
MQGSKLEEIQFDLPGIEEKMRERSRGILHYIVMMVALSRDKNISHEELINWIQEQFEIRGYYHETLLQYGEGNKELFLQDFVKGRSLLYDDIKIFKDERGDYEVRTSSWWLHQEDAIFFYFDIEKEEILNYVQKLAFLKAKRLGIVLDIAYHNNIEYAKISAQH